MECCNRQDFAALQPSHAHDRNMLRRPLYQPTYSPWFDTRVFYVRVISFAVDDLTPDHLTLSYLPLGLDTVVKVNGGRSTAFSDCVSVQLRRDRADKRSEEATYVNTDNIKISGSVCFEVCDKDELLLSGVLELASGDGGGKACEKKWTIRCESHMIAARGLLKGRRYGGLEKRLPTVEVYLAGSFSGCPVILTDTLHLFSPKKNQKKMMLDTIPEYDTTEKKRDTFVDALQVPEYRNTKQDDHWSTDCDPKSMYHMAGADYMGSGEDGELSWFNAGVRVGVGISLGVCVGVGLGVGLLVSSYQTTARNLKRRFF